MHMFFLSGIPLMILNEFDLYRGSPTFDTWFSLEKACFAFENSQQKYRAHG